MENGDYKLSIEQRMTKVETVLTEIKENHLPHLEVKVDRITWLLATTLIAVVLNLLTRIYNIL